MVDCLWTVPILSPRENPEMNDRPTPVPVNRETNGIERMLDRERARYEARLAPCPTCVAPRGAKCVGSATGLDTNSVHRERYREARVDESLDVYVMHDDPLRGNLAASRYIAARRECDLLIISGNVAERNRLLACIPREWWNGREIVAVV